MPNILDQKSGSSTKVLVLGDSGGGKTGGILSLASEGYNLRIIDVENKLDILRNTLLSPGCPYKPDTAKRISYQTVTDPMRPVGGRLVPVSATVWTRVINLLDNWKVGEEVFGSLQSWGEQDCLVIDTLSTLGKHALRFIQSLNATLGKPPSWPEYFQAQELIDGLLMRLSDEGIKCNVVVTAHLLHVTNKDTGITKCYPKTIGKKQAVEGDVGKYFNSVVQVKSIGSGKMAQHKFITVSTPELELKTSSPLTVKPEYPISSGLADLFKDLRVGDSTAAVSTPTGGSTPAGARSPSNPAANSATATSTATATSSKG